MLDLTPLQDAVTQAQTVAQSAIVLIDNLADQVEAAKNDPAAIQAIADTLRANNQALAAAVEANTPAAPPSA